MLAAFENGANVGPAMANFHRDIVEAALLAPSAENTQPWRIASDGRMLIFSIDTTRKLRSDIDMMLDLTGVGACIENAVIAARDMGWRSSLTVHNPGSDETAPDLHPVAALEFERTGDARDPLASQIPRRCTQRRMTAEHTPTDEDLSALSSEAAHLAVRVDWVTDRKQIADLAKLVGIGNRIRFEVREFHREFYDNLRLSLSEAQETRDGLDIATLQLPTHVRWMLGALRQWGRMRAANAFGFSRAVQRQARQETEASGALGLVSVASPTPQAFLAGGRAFQRIWLAATARNLALHPVAALPVFLAYSQRTPNLELPQRQQRLVAGIREGFDKACPELSTGTLQMAFRLGRGPLPKRRSLRRRLDQAYEPSY